MSEQRLTAAARRAAELAEGATERTIGDVRVQGVWLRDAHYLTTTPDFLRAVGAWLEAQAALHEDFVKRGIIRDHDAVDLDRQALAVADALLGSEA